MHIIDAYYRRIGPWALGPPLGPGPWALPWALVGPCGDWGPAGIGPCRALGPGGALRGSGPGGAPTNM